MSRRTFIKQWNPAVPIGGRGRGRRKKGDDPDKAFTSAFRTVHDPSIEARRAAGRDAEGSTRFYSASGLNAAGLPERDDRFRAHTVGIRGGRGGGRGAIQQRVGMFRNAMQSNVIFGGGPSERVMRHSRRKLDRIMAPESDVPESVGEWRRSPVRKTHYRRDVYEYDSEEEEEMPVPPRRRVSKSRQMPSQRKDPEYDPYEFRDDDSADEADFSYHPPGRPPRRSSNARLTTGGPSSSQAPPVYARDRLRARDDRVARPRRLFDGASDEEEEERRGEERHEQQRRERHNKRPRELSPAAPPAAATRQVVTRRYSQRRREPPDEQAAIPPPSTTVRFGGDESTDGASKKTISDAHFTPSIAGSIARRILSGLPPIRLKEDDGSETYLSASRSIISGALDRFMADNEDDADPPPDGRSTIPRKPSKNRGEYGLRALLDKTQAINVSEESDYDDDGEDNEKDRRSFENIFSRHRSDASPVLERLFDKTMQARGDANDDDDEVDTAAMLGLADQQPPNCVDDFDEDQFALVPRTANGSTSSGGGDAGADQFAIVPRTAGESSGSDRGSSTSSLFGLGHRHLPMAASHQAMMASQQQRIAAGAPDSRSSIYAPMASLGATERSFHFQMSGSSRAGVPPNNYLHNNDGSFHFEF